MAKLKDDRLFVELFPVQPRKGERTKYRIIMAAVDCIAEQGFDGAGFEAVGQRVGMARRNVAYHFPDNGALVIAAVQLALATGQRFAVEYLEKEERWERQLEAYFLSTFRWFENHPAHGKIFVSLYAASAAGRPAFSDLYDRVRTTGLQRIVSILTASELPTERVRLETSRSIYDLLTGNIVRFLTTQDSFKSGPYTKHLLVTALSIVQANCR